MSVSNDAAGFQQFVDNKMAYAHMVKLHIDKEFINRMLLLASNDAAKVLESIPKDEIAHVSYDEGGLPVLYANTHEARQHFHQLCCFLQSLPNVSDACLLLQDHVGTRLGDIARSMPHLTSMTILPRLCQGENVSDLAVGLRHHSSIHSIDIQIQPGFYHALLPALETLPQLESLTLNNPYCTMISMLNAEAAARRADNVADFAPQLNPQAFHEFEQLAAQVPNDNDEQGLEEFDPENMTAINSLAVAQVLQTSSLRVVCLRGLDFSSHESQQHLCTGIRNARYTEFSMHECRLCDANSLASALASLQEVKTLRLWILRFTDDALASIFYNALAVDLTRLNQLKFLDCGPFDPGHVSSIEEELSMAALAHAIASCPRMTGMAFSLTSYPGSMDEALATCVRRKPELNHIYVGCPELPENQQPYESPLLLQALKAHYTIESVKLTHPHGLPPPRDSWDASLKENIAILLRLNAFGRKYLANDPTDRNIGLSVLEKAKDDMDCLFVHMRENPLICKREHPVNTS